MDFDILSWLNSLKIWPSDREIVKSRASHPPCTTGQKKILLQLKKYQLLWITHQLFNLWTWNFRTVFALIIPSFSAKIEVETMIIWPLTPQTEVAFILNNSKIISSMSIKVCGWICTNITSTSEWNWNLDNKHTHLHPYTFFYI